MIEASTIQVPPARMWFMDRIQRSDLPSWYGYLSNPDVVAHTSWNLQSENDLLPIFDALDSELPSSIRRLAIISDLTGELIGTIGFHTVSDVNRTAEIAYDLAPTHWGKGVASAVCSAVTQWSFSAFGFIRVQGTVLETNVGSARVLQKCRYRHEGLLRSFRMVRGIPGNFQLYARLNGD